MGIAFRTLVVGSLGWFCVWKWYLWNKEFFLPFWWNNASDHFQKYCGSDRRPGLACAHILWRRRVPRFRPSNKPLRSHSTSLKLISFERSPRYLLNNVNVVSKFEFSQILWLFLSWIPTGGLTGFSNFSLVKFLGSLPLSKFLVYLKL